MTVSAATLGVTVRAPLASNGSWQGTFTVPSGGPGATTAPVVAVCVSSGVPSLLTIYTPQLFSVTAATPPTTTAPGSTQSPTTPPHPPKGGGTTGPPAGTTPRTPPNTGATPDLPAPTLGPGLSATLPGSGFGSVGRGPANTSRPAANASAGPRATAPGKRAARAVEAATLRPADLGAALTADHDGGSSLGWLLWLLLLVLAGAAAGTATWMWWSRRHGADATPAEESV